MLILVGWTNYGEAFDPAFTRGEEMKNCRLAGIRN